MLQYTSLTKNNFINLKHFVVFITFCVLTSCQTTIHNSQTTYQRITINQTEFSTQIDSFITPYRNHINHDLDSILAFVPVTLEKTKGQWQTNIGNWMADVCLEKGNEIMSQKKMNKIDLCLFNHGGIRSIIPAGFVSTRNAFEVMPFENKLIVAELDAIAMQELVETFVAQKKPHPLSGGQIIFNAQNEFIDFKIDGKKIDPKTHYFVLTSDYLSSGGDYMLFFKKAINLYPLEIKIRDVLIENFKQKDTIESKFDDRILLLKD